MDLTPSQMHVLEHLFHSGFRPIAIPPYEKALCVHRGEYAALLGPSENGRLQLLAPATMLVNGNLSVRLKKSTGDIFVWKGTEVPATPDRLAELEKFRTELVAALEATPPQ